MEFPNPNAPNVSRDVVRLWGYGLKGQAYDLFATQDANFTSIGSGLLTGAATGFMAGDVVTNIYMCVQAAGAGAPQPNFYVCIYNPSGTLLAQSANLGAATGAGTIGTKMYPLSTPYIIPATGLYYLAALKQGSWGTTDPQYWMMTTVAAGILPPSFGPQGFMAGAGATPPAQASLSFSNAPMWFGWS